MNRSVLSPVVRHEAGHLAMMAHHGMTWQAVWLSDTVAQIKGASPAPSPLAAASVAVAGAMAEGYELTARRFLRPRHGDPWGGDLRMLRHSVEERGTALLELVKAGIDLAAEVLTPGEVTRWAEHIIAEDRARTARIAAMFAQSA